MNKHSQTKKRRNKQTKKQTRKMQKSFTPLICNPTIKRNPKNQTCYNDNQLQFIRSLWNARHPNDSISKTTSSAQIWTMLKKKYKTQCSDESCWIQQLNPTSNQKNKLKESFAPSAPKDWKKNPNAWLSDVDIKQVMDQYEKAYHCFEFIGPSPIDFDAQSNDPNAKQNPDDDCVWEKLCKFSVQKYLDHKKNKIGIIFNTDPHDKSGKHWISLFINIKKGQIFFFDSVGTAIPKEVMVLVERVIQQGRNQNPPIYFTFDQNHPTEHQYSDTECGVYSLYFIVHMLQDKLTARYLKTHILTDKYIEKYRKIFFN